jgi:hypothetical protein
MAKAQITFDLTNHDDRMDLARYNASLDMALFIWEVLYNGRRRFEDGGTIEGIWQWLWDEARDQGIDIDKLIE